MGIYFNQYCYDLSDFKVASNGSEITIQAVKVENSPLQSVLFTASNGEQECSLLLEISPDGICNFTSCTGGKRGDYTASELYRAAHYDYGFYHCAYDGKSSTCSYNNRRVVTIEASESRLYITSQVPTKVRNGAAIDVLGFKMEAHQLLLCIAKLCGSYAFSPDECSVLESICPKIEQTVPKLNNHQLERLEKEYPVAYESYISGDCIEGVLPMVMDVYSRYS